uniref:Uncharacterized protein n=1 Tax=Rhizophora mucronata TaxID=61149 RepID=A0A2P2NMA6_RHIMU
MENQPSMFIYGITAITRMILLTTHGRRKIDAGAIF